MQPLKQLAELQALATDASDFLRCRTAELLVAVARRVAPNGTGPQAVPVRPRAKRTRPAQTEDRPVSPESV